MSTTTDLDKLHRERVDSVIKAVRGDPNPKYDNLFTSERVVATLQSEKLVLNGFHADKIKAVLPFTPVVYTPICSHCVKAEDFQEFKTFVRSGLVVPILLGSYRFYDAHLREFLISHTHMSYYEYSGYRFLQAVANGSELMCGGCLRDRVDKFCKKIDKRSDAKLYQRSLRQLVGYLEPFPKSDQELIELGFQYCKERKLTNLVQLRRMASMVEQVRVDEAFNSPVLLEDSDLASLPTNLSATVDEAHAKTANLRKLIADGLSISIPADLPTDRYIELVKDYQPRISATVSSVLSSGSSEASISDVSKSIIGINNEIERIKGLRRYVVLDACLGFYRNNKLLAGATMLAGSLGLAGSLMGCLAAGGAAVGASVAKKKGWIKNTEATDRLRRIVSRDLQPAADRFLRTYLGAKSPAINVLSLRRRIQDTKEATAKTAASASA